MSAVPRLNSLKPYTLQTETNIIIFQYATHRTRSVYLENRNTTSTNITIMELRSSITKLYHTRQTTNISLSHASEYKVYNPTVPGDNGFRGPTMVWMFVSIFCS